MNLKERLKLIIDFLKPYQNIWQNEIMLLYPEELTDYPTNWLDDLLRFTDHKDLIRLEKKEVEGLIQDPSLINFYAERKNLIDLPFTMKNKKLPESPWTFLYVIPKKQHEIRLLAPVIHDLYCEANISKIVDIGGGIGLLAQTLVNQYNLKVHSVDLDKKLQETGMGRHEKNAKNPPNFVQYHNFKVGEKVPEFLSLLDEDSLTVGLHTCGTLATDQLKASISKKIKGIISFGCCYHKIENPKDQAISNFTNSYGPLNLTRFALTLASRAHLKLPDQDFEFKLKVKYFRYAIHFLLCDHLKTKDMITLGNSNKQLYYGDFATYALEQLKRIQLEEHFSKDYLNDYFADPKRQELIRRMLAAGIIRDSFGRLLELYLLLDRAVFLEENGYNARLEETFDETISPRNIGLYSQRIN
jgi:Methyltransferase domain